MKKILIITAIIPILSPIFLIYRYGANFPLYDDWTYLPLIYKYNEKALTLADLFSQYNEHRPLIPRVVGIVMLVTTDWNYKSFLWLNLLLSIIYLTIFVSIERDKAFIATMAVFIFSPTNWRMWLWGFSHQVWLTLILSLLSLKFLDSDRSSSKIAGYLAAFLTTLTSASGIILIPFIVILSAIKNKNLVSSIVYSLALCTVYFYKLDLSYYSTPTPDISAFIFLIKSLLLSENILVSLASIAAILVGTVNLIASRNRTLLMFILFLFANLTVISLSRNLLESPYAHRYRILALSIVAISLASLGKKIEPTIIAGAVIIFYITLHLHPITKLHNSLVSRYDTISMIKEEVILYAETQNFAILDAELVQYPRVNLAFINFAYNSKAHFLKKNQHSIISKPIQVDLSPFTKVHNANIYSKNNDIRFCLHSSTKNYVEIYFYPKSSATVTIQTDKNNTTLEIKESSKIALPFTPGFRCIDIKTGLVKIKRFFIRAKTDT